MACSSVAKADCVEKRFNMCSSFVSDGYQVSEGVLTSTDVAALQKSLQVLKVVPGHRQLMRRVPAVAALAASGKIMDLVSAALGEGARAVRSLFFDKTPEANWLVPWHQDLTIATSRQVELPGYSPWSRKDGVPHVQPPVVILESMVTVRVHLDDCDQANGALRVLPGSHRQGRLTAGQITETRSQTQEVTCEARAGDVLLMRPLLLHSSGEARAPLHRRVVHLEYAACQLPAGLEWAELGKAPILR
jgi:ectoine hydroxylase-related dioxygenase (phytanoyl-CoA dioxygenase family)